MPCVETSDEMSVVRARFRALACEWNLGSSEAASLLHVRQDDLGIDLLPAILDREAEHRLRLLVELRRLLPGIVGDGTPIDIVIRAPTGGSVVDERDEPVASLLTYMAGPRDRLSALVRALRSQPTETILD